MNDVPIVPADQIVNFHKQEVIMMASKMLASIVHLNNAVLRLARDEKPEAMESLRLSGEQVDAILQDIRDKLTEAE